MVSRHAVEQICSGGWIRDCLDHFLECHDYTVNYFRFKDYDDDILQDQSLLCHVSQCTQPDCFLKGRSNYETVNLIKLLMDHHKFRRPSPKPMAPTALTLISANNSDPSDGQGCTEEAETLITRPMQEDDTSICEDTAHDAVTTFNAILCRSGVHTITITYAGIGNNVAIRGLPHVTVSVEDHGLGETPVVDLALLSLRPPEHSPDWLDY